MCCAKKDEWEVWVEAGGWGWWMADGGALQSRVVKKCGRLVAGIRRECRNWFVREG